MSKDFHLTIGNKNYSSWSLCAWLCLKTANIDFIENKIILGVKGSHKKIKEFSPSGFVPALRHQKRVIWDSLAIAEYINELKFGALYPKDTHEKAICRSIISELHSGFVDFRKEAPLNIRKKFKNIEFSKNALWQINRIIELIDNRLTSSAGEFLFGNWGMADIFYTQIAFRFLNYHITVPKNISDYFEKIIKNIHVKEWVKDALNEKENIAIIDELRKA